MLNQSMYSATAISRSSMLSPRPPVADQFGLEQRVERLGHGVVVGIPFAANGRDGAGLGQALGVTDRDVLPGFKGSSQRLRRRS